MKIILLTVLLFITNCQTANTQNKSVENNSELNPPKMLEVFEPNVISKFERWTFTPTFSKDMQTLIFTAWDNPNVSNINSIQKLYQSKKVNGRWAKPTEIKETSGHRVDWVHFSPDGKYFLLSYAKPHEGHYKFPDNKGFEDFDIWIAPTNEGGDIDWEDLKPIKGADINRIKTPKNKSIGYVHNETGPRMDLAGNLYFWTERLDDGGGRRDLYFAPIKNLDKLEWNKAEILSSPINSRFNESGNAISPDGKWMIFSSARPNGIGGSDLYFSKKISQTDWSTPLNLGEKVNSSKDEGSPQLSPDGKSLFFTSSRSVKGKPAVKDGEGGENLSVVYWISIDSLNLPID